MSLFYEEVFWNFSWGVLFYTPSSTTPLSPLQQWIGRLTMLIQFLPNSPSKNEGIFFPVENQGRQVSGDQSVDPSRGPCEVDGRLEARRTQRSGGDARQKDERDSPAVLGHLEGKSDEQLEGHVDQDVVEVVVDEWVGEISPDLERTFWFQIFNFYIRYVKDERKMLNGNDSILLCTPKVQLQFFFSLFCSGSQNKRLHFNIELWQKAWWILISFFANPNSWQNKIDETILRLLIQTCRLRWWSNTRLEQSGLIVFDLKIKRK